MHKRPTFLLLLLTFLSGSLFAQLGREGKHVVNFRPFQWKVVSTESFDVYYYSPDQNLANLAAQYAEEALYQTERLLDYRHKDRFALWLYTQDYDLVRSNQFGRDELERAGVTALINNSGTVLYPGSMKGLRANVKSETVHLLLKEFYYGGGIQISIQNQVLLHTPEWFVQGLSDYIGEGWTFEDEMYLSGLAADNFVEKALYGEEHINRVVRKSIWFYISRQYGLEKLSEIFYMTRLTRSVEGGVITVLGITLKTLTERWREFMVGRISANAENREVFETLGDKVPLNKKDRLISHAVNPKDGTVALFLMRRGKQRVELYDPSTRTFSATGIEGGFLTDQTESLHLKVPMAWSQDGRYLLTMVFDNGFEKMTLLDSKGGNISSIPYRPMVDRVLGFAWHPEENMVIVSALKYGQVDLFYYKPGSNQFREITDDPYDNLYPVISPDGQYVYFASNRDSAQAQTEHPDYKTYRNFLDIYRLNLNEKDALPEKITSTDEVDEIPLAFASSFEILALSDESGIFNLIKRNVFVGEVTRLTDIRQGFAQISVSDSLVSFSSPLRGQMNLYLSNTDHLYGEHNLIITDLRFLKHLAWEQIRKLEEKISMVEEPTKEIKDKNVPDPEETKPDSGQKEVKFYVFDEEEDDQPKDSRTKKRSKPRPVAEKEKEERKDFNSIEIKAPARAKTKWASDYISTMLGYSPAWYGRQYRSLLNMSMDVGFSDLEGNHRINAGLKAYFFDFKSRDLYFNYSYLKHRTDFFVGIDRSRRYLNSNDFLLRYNTIGLNAGAIYPFNRFSSLAARAHLNYIDRVDLDLLGTQGLDGHDIAPGLGASYVYDDTRKLETFMTSGTRAEADLISTYSTTNKSLNFVSLRLDARRYTPIFKSLVLATRLAAGGSIGPNKQRFLMGGVDNWLFSAIQNGSELPLADAPGISSFAYMDYITPMRGFLFNARNGTKYVAANAELRIPISRLVTNSLNTNPVYNLEFIPFFDIGTIWEQGNPLSQRNPINNDPIVSYPLTINVQTLKSPFLIGFGTGLRATVFGYSMRADLAWGMEDYTVLKPKVHLSLGKNF